METVPLVPNQDRAESVRLWFREDPSRMTMMAARKFSLSGMLHIWFRIRRNSGVLFSGSDKNDMASFS